MKKTIIALSCMGLATAQTFGYVSNELDWKSNAADGNLASAANWSNIPSGVTDIGYNLTTDEGYWGKFMIGSKTLDLNISSAFTFDCLYFQGSNSKYNIDLGGNTLTLRGAYTYELTTNPSYKPQNVVITNGDIAFSSKSTRREFRAQGEGNVIAIAGTEEIPVTISGGSLTPTATSGGELVFSNTVFASGTKKVLVNSSGSKLSFIGQKTTLSCSSANDYFGVGSSAASNTMVIAGGAKVLANNSYLKNAILVGDAGDYNMLVVAGEGTVLSNSTRTATSGDASIAVGKRSNGNFLHVTDGAELNLTSHIVIGNPLYDANRGSSANNCIRIDTNAVVYASGLRIGQRSNNGSGDAFFTSNVCEVAKNAKVYLSANEGVRLATQSGIDYCSMSISEEAQVFAKYVQVGVYGASNRMDVATGGAIVSSATSPSGMGLALGGATSTGTVFNVDGGFVGLTNTLFAMNGASAGSETLVRIANGGDICTQFVAVTNVGNRIEIDNATLSVRTLGRFPQTDDSSVALSFSGAHPLLAYEDVSHGTVVKEFSFRAGASLEFFVPAGGYAEAPIRSANGITIAGLASAKIDAASFRTAGGQEQVLMDAGAGTISIDATSVDILNAAAGARWGVKLSDNGKQLVLSRKGGFILIVR